MFCPHGVLYFSLYMPVSPFLEIQNANTNFKIWQITWSRLASATTTWLPQHLETEPMISGKWLRSWKSQSDLFLADEDISWGNAKCFLGSLTVVASGEKLHKRENTASKYSQIQIRNPLRTGLMGRQLNALCSVCLMFMFYHSQFRMASLEIALSTWTFKDSWKFL